MDIDFTWITPGLDRDRSITGTRKICSMIIDEVLSHINEVYSKVGLSSSSEEKRLLISSLPPFLDDDIELIRKQLENIRDMIISDIGLNHSR